MITVLLLLYFRRFSSITNIIFIYSNNTLLNRDKKAFLNWSKQFTNIKIEWTA